MPTDRTGPVIRPRVRLSLIALARGFTLLDLVAALAVAGVLLGIALPSARDAVSRVRAGAARAAISATLFDAQRAATVLGQDVAVCPGSGTACLGGQDWSEGWIAFVDGNGDGLRGGDEAILRSEPPLPAGIGLRGTAGRPRIVYHPNGGSAGSNITFTLCDRRGPQEAQALVLSNGGRLRRDRADPGMAAACVAGL